MILCFFFKQKTAYEMRIRDWSSDVCSSDLQRTPRRHAAVGELAQHVEGFVEGEEHGGRVHLSVVIPCIASDLLPFIASRSLAALGMTKMTPALPASLAPSPSRLHKPQCHPVALADRLVLRVVRVVVVVARRQGPHAVGVVLGVLRVGVDLALRIEREAGRLGHRDHLLLAAVAGLVVVGDVAFRAMLDPPSTPPGPRNSKQPPNRTFALPFGRQFGPLRNCTPTSVAPRARQPSNYG